MNTGKLIREILIKDMVKMLKNDDLTCLAMPLPEDIMKEKWSGHFDRARAMINCRMEEPNLPEILRIRLAWELKNLDHLECRYTVSREEALAQVQEAIPGMTEEEFEQLQMENKMDWSYINGEAYFLDNFCRNLVRVYPKLLKRSEKSGDDGAETAAGDPLLTEYIGSLTNGQETAVRIHLRHDLYLKPEAVEEGKTLHVYIPLPVERDQVTNLRVIATSHKPKKMPDLSEPQPTVYFEEKAEKGQIFSVEYAFDHVERYVDLSQADLNAVAEAAKNLPEDVKPYLAEELPHLVFTPYLKALAAELKGEETNPLVIARRFYDFVTKQVDYRFVRDYASIDNLSEYCAVNLRGDCGIQALCFIVLCRIAGIPAKWQSGLAAEPDSIGEHDWAQFYVPSIGWVYADPSFGGGARRRGDEAQRLFYFGNLDPYRIPINNAFPGGFVPEKKFLRDDPDNQCGEAEYDDHGIYGGGVNRRYVEIDIHRIK